MKKTIKLLTVLLTLFTVCALSTALAAATSDPVEINPELIFSPQTTLSVFIDGEASDVLTDNYPYGEEAVITAPEIDGKTFRYWTNGEGTVISYGTKLTLNMYSSTVVNAVYGSSSETSKPVAAFVNITRTDGEIIFNAIGSGIRCSTTKSTLEGLKGDDDVTVETASGSPNWTLTLTPADESTVYYAVVYNDATYSEVKAVKLSELESGVSMVINLGDVTIPDLGDSLCSVTFEANGGDGVMLPQGMVKGRATALSANTFTRESYSFSGWGTAPSGSVAYTNGQTVTLNDNITLYAIWSNGSSSGGSSGGGSSSSTVTVPVSGEDATVNVQVEVKGETATIKNADVDKVINAKDVGTVTIDVSGLNKNIDEAVISGAMVQKIATAVADNKNDADGLEIKLSTGTVSLDADSMKTVAQQTGNSDLTLHLDSVKVTELNSAQQGAVKDLEIQVVLDAYFTAGNKRITDFGGGSATVKIPYTLKSGQKAAGIVVWYVDSKGERTQIRAGYDGKNVVFAVPHFSNYVIAYDVERAKECPKDSTCPMSAFTDLPLTAWYHDGVHYVLQNSIMNGNGDGTFGPDTSLSRAMMAQILWNMEGRPSYSGAIEFSDINLSAWYVNAIRWAYAEGIMDGYGEGLFGPDDPITREQLATILYRHAKSNGKGFTGTWMYKLDFSDAPAVSSWANEAMHWMVMNGVINGKDGYLIPGGNASRAEAATMLMRYSTLEQ